MKLSIFLLLIVVMPVLILLTAVMPALVSAQEPATTVDDRESVASPNSQESAVPADSTYRNRTLLLPAIGSSPETGFLIGGVVVPQFKVGNAGPETRSSSILISAIYTFKNQILTSVVPDIILPGEEWVFNGVYSVNYFPQNFWGVGPFTDNDAEILALYTEFSFEQNVLRRVRPGLFTGPFLRWTRYSNISFENSDGDPVAAPVVAGTNGSTSAALGWIGRWDLRNSNMTPTQKHYVEFSFLANPSWLGSTDPYAYYKLDARKYADLHGDGRSVLAFQALMRLTTGNPPFQNLSLLGGDIINRGYYEGRYRDQNAAQIQVEFRQQAYRRFGFTLFAGTGEVWNRFSNFTMRNYKWTAGAGLRFNLNPEDPTNLRIDFGFGKETAGFYLQFGEAF